MTLINKTWLKQEIIRLFLSGESQENIAVQLNISVGTVNNFVNEIMKSDDTIELQRQIAIISKKSGVSIAQIAFNLRCKNQIIKQSALDDKKMEKFIDAMDVWCNKYSIPPTALAEHLFSIIEITLRENIEPHKLEEVIKSEISELREIKDEIETSKKLLEETETNVEEEQKRLKIKQKDLDQFHQFSQLFELYEIPEFSTKYGDIVHLLIDIKNMGYDPKAIISKYNGLVSLIAANQKLKIKLQEEEKILQNYKSKSDEERIRWKDYDDAFEIFTRLVKAGLKVQDIFTVAQILINDYTPDIISRLIEDIHTYGSIAAAKSKLKRESEEEDDFLV
ncbi:MAG TPA: hypothetical protein VJS91_07290 [Nitrososphaeraceae archaeon]|nr:hypothetical protein [Nitrososphaeraceae archaeon]